VSDSDFATEQSLINRANRVESYLSRSEWILPARLGLPTDKQLMTGMNTLTVDGETLDPQHTVILTDTLSPSVST
jgi:hypothetical protein